MKVFIFSITLVAASLFGTPTIAAPQGITGPAIVVAQSLVLFDTESGAQSHCPHDTVVWLNTASGIYHYKGERWYGRTKHGAFVCEKAAIAAGDRASENGQ